MDSRVKRRVLEEKRSRPGGQVDYDVFVLRIELW
jgi:hypothetical protein